MFLLTFRKHFRLTQKMATIQKSLAHIRPTEDLKLSVLKYGWYAVQHNYVKKVYID